MLTEALAESPIVRKQIVEHWSQCLGRKRRGEDMWVDFDEGFSKKNGGLVIGCEMFFNKDDYDVVDVDDHHNREYWI